MCAIAAMAARSVGEHVRVRGLLIRSVPLLSGGPDGLDVPFARVKDQTRRSNTNEEKKKCRERIRTTC